MKRIYSSILLYASCGLLCVNVNATTDDELKKRIEVLEKSDKQKTAEINRLKNDNVITGAGLNQLIQSFDAFDDRFHIDGFMSIGVGTIDENDVEYGRTTLNGGGGPDFNADTFLGVQMAFTMSDAAEVVTQLVSKGTGQDAQVDAEWFYLNYRFDDNISFQLGRIRAPIYMLSDYKEVGFTYPWVRPPLEVYDAVPVDHSQGAKVHYRNFFGDYEFHAQLFYSSSIDKGKVSNFDADRVRGSVFDIGQENWMVGFGIFDAHVKVELTDENAIALTEGLATISGILGVDTPVFIDLNDEVVSLTNVHFRWDDGDWQVLAEAQQADYEGFFADFDSYYVSAGRRFGKWFPYLLHMGNRTTDDDERDAIISMVTPLIPLSSNVARLANGINSMSFESKSYVVGVGYEITPRIKAKFETQLVTDMNDTLGPFKLVNGNSAPISDDIWIYSFVIDTVF